MTTPPQDADIKTQFFQSPTDQVNKNVAQTFFNIWDDALKKKIAVALEQGQVA